MGGYSRREMRAREHARKVEESLPFLDKWYEDGDGMFHYPDGTLVPDGVYRTANGVILYEGNFATMAGEG